MNKTSRVSLVIGVFIVTLLFAQSAFAKVSSNSIKPGWGFGDTNHVHIGPPGLSDRLDDIFKHQEDRLNHIFNRQHDFLTQLFDRLRHLFG